MKCPFLRISRARSSTRVRLKRNHHTPPQRMPGLPEAFYYLRDYRASAPVVVKRDGSRQQFDRVKLINGMVRACEKRPVKPFAA